MSKTELERHLLEGLKRMDKENQNRLETQEARLSKMQAIQEAQSKEIRELKKELKNQRNETQELSEYYNNLEPLLQRLNDILKKAK